MQKVIYTNALGGTAVFGQSSGDKYFFEKILSGTGGVGADYQKMKAVEQDGYTLYSISLPDRSLTLTGAVNNEHANGADLDRELSNILNPKAAIIKDKSGAIIKRANLTFIKDGFEYEIFAVPEETPVFTERQNTLKKFTASFYCPQPYWSETHDNISRLAYITGGMTFPLRPPFQMGKRAQKINIHTSSTAHLPVKMVIIGPSDNPIITNETTGESMRIKQPLFSGETMFINTNPEELEVTITRASGETENATNYLTADSDLLTLAPGDNILSYLSFDENFLTKVSIIWRNRYAGV